MKKDWEIKKLGDVCETSSGGTPLKGHKEYYENGTIPWLRSGEVCKKDICESELFITETGLKKSSAKLFPVNTVLVAMYGATAGQTGILRFESTTNQAICGILPNSKFVPEFIYYFFLSYKEKLIVQAVGGAQPNISQVKICNSPIPVPPLEEQKRIVKILDEKFAQLETIKANAQINLQNAKDLFQSQLAKVFSNTTWEKKRLGDFCESFEYGTSKKSSADGKVPVLRMGNIKNGKLDFTDLVYSNDEDEIKKYLLSKGDVLFNRTNSPEWVGKTAVFEEDFPAIFAGYIIRVNYDKKIINPYYLNYWLNSKETMEYGFSVMTSSVHQANISGTKLAEYKIPLPPLPDQKRIVEELDTLSEKVCQLQEIYTKQILDCDELKQSLLAKAFEGNL